MEIPYPIKQQDCSNEVVDQTYFYIDFFTIAWKSHCALGDAIWRQYPHYSVRHLDTVGCNYLVIYRTRSTGHFPKLINLTDTFAYAELALSMKNMAITTSACKRRTRSFRQNWRTTPPHSREPLCSLSYVAKTITRYRITTYDGAISRPHLEFLSLHHFRAEVAV